MLGEACPDSTRRPTRDRVPTPRSCFPGPLRSGRRVRERASASTSGSRSGKSAWAYVPPRKKKERRKRNGTPQKASGESVFWAAAAAVPSERDGAEPRHHTSLFFLFFHLAALSFGLLDNFVLQLLRDYVVVVHFHREAATALRHRSQIGAVGQHLGHGHLGFHDGVAGFVVHALDASAAAVEVAHDGSGELVGHGDLDGHDGFEQRGLGRFHGLAESDAAGHLERQVIRIDVVVGTVVEDGAEVHYGIAREKATGSGVLDSFFDGGYEVARDGAAKNIVDELELNFGIARQRFHLDFAIAVLAVATGLLLVASLDVGLTANGFAVGYLGRFQHDFGVVPLLHLRDYDFDVLLSGARDQEFLGLRVAEEAQHGIFFHQFVQAYA